MTSPLPAVLIGGPPHAGKSVLLYNLRRALYESGVTNHHVIRPPDGEGDWYQEGNPDTVSDLAKSNRGGWPDEFIKRMSLDLQHRRLPLLVDMGGEPQPNELPIFQQCTHSILLLREDRPDLTHVWLDMVSKANLTPLAQLFSIQGGSSAITATEPFLQGSITGLERHSQTVRNDAVFKALLERIISLLNEPSLQGLERNVLQQAPTEVVLNLPEELKHFTTASIDWQPEMLAPFLSRVPANTPLSVYGRASNWLYAALIAHAEQQPFYQSDPKLPFDWVEPVHVCISEKTEPSSEIVTARQVIQDATVLTISFPSVKRIQYIQPEPLAFPPVSPDHGLILDGPLPFWLLTAVVRLYQQAGVAWIAPHYAQQNKQEPRKTAVVSYSQVTTRHVGDLVDFG